MSTDELLFLAAASKNVFTWPKSEIVAEMVLAAKIEVSVSNATSFFDVFVTIAESVPILSVAGRDRLVDSLPLFDFASQQRFLTGFQSDLQLLVSIWDRFVQRASSDTNLDSRCSEFLLNLIFKQLHSDCEETKLAVLDFLQDSESAGRSFGSYEACKKSHLFAFIPSLLPLLSDSRESIRAAASATLNTVRLELKEMVSTDSNPTSIGPS
jgi:hypothetical protein